MDKITNVRCLSGVIGEQGRLRDLYQNLESLKYASSRRNATESIGQRLGYVNDETAWNRNPIIQQSKDPDDLRVIIDGLYIKCKKIHAEAKAAFKAFLDDGDTGEALMGLSKKINAIERRLKRKFTTKNSLWFGIGLGEGANMTMKEMEHEYTTMVEHRWLVGCFRKQQETGLEIGFS